MFLLLETPCGARLRNEGGAVADSPFVPLSAVNYFSAAAFPSATISSATSRVNRSGSVMGDPSVSSA